MVLDVKPEQVTLVPDADNAITSNAGWDCEKNLGFLKNEISEKLIKNIFPTTYFGFSKN